MKRSTQLWTARAGTTKAYNRVGHGQGYRGVHKTSRHYVSLIAKKSTYLTSLLYARYSIERVPFHDGIALRIGPMIWLSARSWHPSSILEFNTVSRNLSHSSSRKHKNLSSLTASSLDFAAVQLLVVVDNLNNFPTAATRFKCWRQARHCRQAPGDTRKRPGSIALLSLPGVTDLRLHSNVSGNPNR